MTKRYIETCTLTLTRAEWVQWLRSIDYARETLWRSTDVGRAVDEHHAAHLGGMAARIADLIAGESVEDDT